MWEEYYNKVLAGKDKHDAKKIDSFTSDLDAIQNRLSRVADKLASLKIDVEKDFTELTGKIADLKTNINVDESAMRDPKKSKKKTSACKNLIGSFKYNIEAEMELIKKLKCEKFSELSLKHLYETTEKMGDLDMMLFFDYIQKAHQFFLKYREDLDGAINTDITKNNEMTAEFKAIDELLEHIRFLVSQGAMIQKKVSDLESLRDYLPEIIEMLESKTVFSSDEVERNQPPLDTFTPASIPVPASIQTEDKPKKKPWYRKIADSIEKYIPFLGRFFNRMLDRLFGKINEVKPVVLGKSQDIGSETKKTGNTELNSPIHKKQTNAQSDKHHSF